MRWAYDIDLVKKLHVGDSLLFNGNKFKAYKIPDIWKRKMRGIIININESMVVVKFMIGVDIGNKKIYEIKLPLEIPDPRDNDEIWD